MNKAFAKDTSLVREEIKQYELMISDGSHDVNPLFTPIKRLLDIARSGVQQSESAAREIKRYKTQLDEINRSLELATRIDPLTGLANRRDIMEKLEQEHSRTQRHKRTYSLILVSIDNFKQINDRYGINCGDDVLFEVSCVLRDCVRNEDVCSRWGGKEFLFLLPETPVDGAISVARKINYSLEMTEFKANKPGIRITASLGVCGFRSGESFVETLRRVEEARLTAKEKGRNRYEVTV